MSSSEPVPPPGGLEPVDERAVQFNQVRHILLGVANLVAGQRAA